MVANGHSWSSIKEYTLSEIGVFFKTIVIREREKKIERLSYLWYGNNLTYKGLKETLTKMGVSMKQEEELPTDKEVQRDWNRLANMQSKLR